MTQTTAEFTWISFSSAWPSHLLTKTATTTLWYLSAFYMTINLVFHTRSKHIKIDYYYVWDSFALGLLYTWYVLVLSKLVDILTKSLGRLVLSSLCTKLGLIQRHSLWGAYCPEQINKTWKLTKWGVHAATLQQIHHSTRKNFMKTLQKLMACETLRQALVHWLSLEHGKSSLLINILTWDNKIGSLILCYLRR